jgi:hypothetical protein
MLVSAYVTLRLWSSSIDVSQILGTVVHYVGALWWTQLSSRLCHGWLNSRSPSYASGTSTILLACMAQERKRVRFDRSLVTPDKFRYITLLVDSGASHHICNLSRDYFQNLRSCDLTFTTANGGEFSCTHMGDLLHLRKVCLTESIINLASVPRFCDEGMVVVFDRHKCAIYPASSFRHTSEPVYTARRDRDAYLLKLPLDSTAAPESVHLPSDSLSLPHAMVLVDVHVMNTCAMWHQRLNLITLRSIRKVC